MSTLAMIRAFAPAVLVALLCLPASASGQEPGEALADATDDPAREEARLLFEEGVAAFRDGRPADARRSFAASLERWAMPVTAWNLARSMLSIGDPIDALATVQAMLAEAHGALDAEQRSAAEDLREEILASLGTLRMTSAATEPLEVAVDAAPIGTLPPRGTLEHRVVPGAHVVRATARDARQVTERATVAAGATATLRLVLPPPAAADGERESSGLSPAFWWITGGVVVVAAAAVAAILLIGPADDGEVDPFWGNVEALGGAR